MPKVMMNVRSMRAPTLAELQQKFGLKDAEIDKDFGVVEIDPDDHLYTIRVDDTAAKKVNSDFEVSTQGPFSDPIISPFGPPQSKA